MSRVFPEFDTIVSALSAKSILELLRKYPTPAQIARARLSSIEAIPNLRSKTARRLHDASKTPIGSLTGPVAETMVRTLVDQICFAQKLKSQYERLLIETYRSLAMGGGVKKWASDSFAAFRWNSSGSNRPPIHSSIDSCSGWSRSSIASRKSE